MTGTFLKTLALQLVEILACTKMNVVVLDAEHAFIIDGANRASNAYRSA